MIDDLLATGDTLKAAEDLISRIPGAAVAGCFCIFEVPGLNGRQRLSTKVVSIVELKGIDSPENFHS